MTDIALLRIEQNDYWPSNEVERLEGCPVCGGAGKIVFTHLTDIVFNCAPGSWTIKSCLDCGSAFLDPRPDEKSIGRAYRVYYTHGKTAEEKESKLLADQGLLRNAINARLNIRYGTTRRPQSLVLGHLLNSIPFIGSFFDPLGRSIHLPPYKGAALLDFGCGDGRFLSFADEMGWRSLGVDFDANAVAVAQGLGLDVRLGGFEALKPEERFDAITMSHVIEHVHDPAKTLEQCFSLLKSEGKIILETPNFDAFGRMRFGEFWRGLECPRHLVIFNQASLRKALESAGFVNIACTSRHFVSLSMYAESRSLRVGKKSGRKSLRDLLDIAAIYDGFRALFQPTRTEFLRFVATKP